VGLDQHKKKVVDARLRAGETRWAIRPWRWPFRKPRTLGCPRRTSSGPSPRAPGRPRRRGDRQRGVRGRTFEKKGEVVVDGTRYGEDELIAAIERDGKFLV